VTSDAPVAEPGSEPLLVRVDHLVYGAPDLGHAVELLERLLGVRAEKGGSHAGEGTCNALLALGPSAYLEILAPDPEQPAPPRPRWFGIDALRSPRLVAWAANESDLDGFAARARRDGIALPQIVSGSRRRPDGSRLAWRFTDPHLLPEGSVLPFFLDWGDTPHPAASAPRGARLTGLRAEHPGAAGVRDALARLGVPLPVAKAPRPALVATIEGAKGEVELR
jgi:hypothetical protein